MKLDINKPIIYDCSSHRRFRKGERHITRVCGMSVLLLVYEGVLRFGEGETQIEVKSGEYYIQRAGIAQNGLIESDCPRYYYVHFSGEYTENDGLSLRSKWQPEAMMPLIEGMEGNADSGSLSPLAVGRSFGGLSALPVICPYRAEQATGLAGGYDYCI